MGEWAHHDCVDGGADGWGVFGSAGVSVWQQNLDRRDVLRLSAFAAAAYASPTMR